MKKFNEIFGYLSYRKYLEDFLEFKKNTDYGYSYRQFSKLAGFSSPSVLPSVISGQKKIGQRSIPKYLKALNLTGKQAEYFTILVNMNNEKSEEKIEFYRNSLIEVTPKSQRKLLTEEHYQYLSHWLYPVLEEMSHIDNFNEDIQWIKGKLIDNKISDNEIASALNFLKRNRFLKKNDSGSISATGKIITIPSRKKSLAIRRMHRMLMEQAIALHDSVSQDEREYRSVTFSVPKSYISEIKKQIIQFKDQLLEHYSQISSDHDQEEKVVTQLNIQFFKHTH